jgi:hypothetical protein
MTCYMFNFQVFFYFEFKSLQKSNYKIAISRSAIKEKIKKNNK